MNDSLSKSEFAFHQYLFSKCWHLFRISIVAVTQTENVLGYRIHIVRGTILFLFNKIKLEVPAPSDFVPASSKEFLDIQATVEYGFTLKRVRDMTSTYS